MKVTSTTTTLFEDEASRLCDQRTFHIFGVDRGGTTAVAGLTRAMGVPIGDDLAGNLEDMSFRHKRGIEALCATVEERNAAHDIWGWKHPHSLSYFDAIRPVLRNPRLILVTRDATANSLGSITRDGGEELDALNFVVNQTHRNLTAISERQLPTLMMSYEKLLIRPEAAIAELATFCNFVLDDRQIAALTELVHPGHYVKPVPDGLAGRVFRRLRGR